MSAAARTSRNAVTHWRVLRRYPEDRLTLVDLLLETGRTHQIRVHLASRRHPVVGDQLYGGTGRSRAIADETLRGALCGLARQFLHAWQLGFDHPDGGQMIFQAALPDELQGSLLYLEEKYQHDLKDLDIATCAGPVETKADENGKAG